MRTRKQIFIGVAAGLGLIALAYIILITGYLLVKIK